MGAVQTRLGRIGVVQGGNGPATPLVFLHGVGSDKSVWHPQLDHFGKSRPCFAFDYPGYGESEFIDGADRDQFAAAILAAFDALEIERAHVCGLSLGGVIAIAMHHAAPTRFASLILADTFAVHPQGSAIYQRAIGASSAMSMRELAEARAPLLLGKSATAEVRDEVIATMGAIEPDAYRLGAAAVWLAEQVDRVKKIDVPTLVIVGAEDTITPPALSEQLIAMIEGSKLHILGRSGHLGNLEEPAEFNSAVNGHLTEIE